MQSRQSYPNDLSDQEWQLIAPLVTFKRTPRGRGFPLQTRNVQCHFLSLENRVPMAPFTS